MKRITLSLVLIALLAWCSYAGGYQVRLQGQKQTGMGLVGSPLNFGASSLFYNPGGLSFMEKKFGWHGKTPKPEEAEIALKEIAEERKNLEGSS